MKKIHFPQSLRFFFTKALLVLKEKFFIKNLKIKNMSQNGAKTISEKNENHEYFTSEGSKLLRQLSLACIGVIWLFKIDNTTTLPHYLKSPIILFVIALSLDFIHYLLGALFSHFNDSVKGEFSFSQNIVINGAFYLKLIIGLSGFCYMAWELFSQNVLFN